MSVTKSVRKIGSTDASELIKVDMAERDGNGKVISSTYAKLTDIPDELPADGGSADYATNAGTVNNHTVNSNVPANAVFTDTWRPITIGGASVGNNSFALTNGDNVTFTTVGAGAFKIGFSLPSAIPSSWLGTSATTAAKGNHTHANMATYESNGTIGKVLTPSQDALMLPNMGNYAVTNIAIGSVTISSLSTTVGSEASVDISLPKTGAGTWYVMIVPTTSGSNTVTYGVERYSQGDTNTRVKYRLWVRRSYASSNTSLTFNYIALKWW